MKAGRLIAALLGLFLGAALAPIHQVAAQDMQQETHQETHQEKQRKTMFKLTIMYPVTPDGVFNFDYYLKKHMPLSLKLQGAAVKSVLVEKGYDGGMPGVSLAYVAICHFTYDSQQAFLDAFLPHAQELEGDIAKYTNITPVIQFSTVELDEGAEGAAVSARP